jgi:hypothetical protein
MTENAQMERENGNAYSVFLLPIPLGFGDHVRILMLTIRSPTS